MTMELLLRLYIVLFVSLSTSKTNAEDGFDFLEVGSSEPSRVFTVEVGKLFYFHLPKSSPNNRFEVKRVNSTKLPHWLIFQKKTGIFMGVPLEDDVETLRLTIYNVPSHKEVLTVQVTNKSLTDETKYLLDKKAKVVQFLINKDIKEISPIQRISIINKGAKYLQIPASFLKITPYYEDVSTFMPWSSLSSLKVGTAGTLIQAQLGCGVKSDSALYKLMTKMKHFSRSMPSLVFGFPLVGWKVNTFLEREKRGAPTLDDYGSGVYEDEYYDAEYEEEDPESEEISKDLGKEGITEIPETIDSFSTTVKSTVQIQLPTHPHRHHHGETKVDNDSVLAKETISTNLTSNHNSSEKHIDTATLPLPTKNSSISIGSKNNKTPEVNLPDYGEGEYAWSYDDMEDTDNDMESETIVPILNNKPNDTKNYSSSTTTDATTLAEVEPTTTPKITFITVPAPVTAEASTFQIIDEPGIVTYTRETTTPVPATTVSTNVTTAITSSTDGETTDKTEFGTIDINNTTTVETVTSTTTTERLPPVTIETIPVTNLSGVFTTNVIEEEKLLEVTEPTRKEELPVTPVVKNYKPFIENRLQYLSVTAGKVFRFVIPKNTFNDVEDEYNLTLHVFDSKEQPISNKSWLRFNPLRRELYGLPLVEDVSNWEYVVRATDKEGASDQDRLTIQVQQHPLEKVVNHEFLMTLRIEKSQEFHHYTDWALKILRALGTIYHTNMSEITVRHIETTSFVTTFAWTNDSLPTTHCPRHEIEEIFKIITANDKGDPSRELSTFLMPSLRAKKVMFYELGICAKQTPPPVTAGTNFSPILRNPVDKVNATINELLVFKVKDDTFYDPEDFDPAMLNITLLTSDFKPIPPTNWLQFDNKNREFFGIPRKVSKSQYWLICVDTGGMSVRDSLEVEVYPSSKRHFNVEFSMTIEVPYDKFSNSAILQRKFTEKLMELFEDNNPSNFYFPLFKQKRDPIESTVIYWFNKSLPIEKCSIDEIKRLEYILHNSDQKSISSKVHRIMSPEFTVSTIKVHHIGNCKTKPQVTVSPNVEDVIPVEETTPSAAENEVMVTFVMPAIIIIIMLFIAAAAACVLYKRKLSGKLNIDDVSRQSYGNKGIPVIFQEELDEKPETRTKTPVILKDEKPPLAPPPEYNRSGSFKLDDSEPYQPPPPFARTQDKQFRPKPTPTYRKPPPYVPP